MKIDHNELLFELNAAIDRTVNTMANVAGCFGMYCVARLEGHIDGLRAATEIIKHLAQRELIRGKKEEEK